ncbi:hypothetical protein Q3G72_008699 [Acer saccharum]|nr:hypothetical protein Q3G72_008699 [Acer saccharum]
MRRLVLLWCAEGFVTTPVPMYINPEDIVEMCKEELVTRNMVEVIRWGAEGGSKTWMPNVLYDFFSSKSAANVGFLYHHHFRMYTRSYVAFDTHVPITSTMAIDEFLGRITNDNAYKAGIMPVVEWITHQLTELQSLKLKSIDCIFYPVRYRAWQSIIYRLPESVINVDFLPPNYTMEQIEVRFATKDDVNQLTQLAAELRNLIEDMRHDQIENSL